MDNFNNNPVDVEDILALEEQIESEKLRHKNLQIKHLRTIGRMSRAEARKNPEVKALKNEMVISQKILQDLVVSKKTMSDTRLSTFEGVYKNNNSFFVPSFS